MMKKSLGRGLAALIPEADMDFLRQVARQEHATSAATSRKPRGKTQVASDMSAPNLGNEAMQNQDSPNTQKATLPQTESLSSDSSSSARPVSVKSIIANPFQPRRTFSEIELEELASSIREHGVLQPVLLRPTDDPQQYQLIAGERRWRAAQKAGLSTIPAVIRSLNDRQALELAIIENVQRHDISAIDAALAYKRLAQEFSLSQDEIAHRVGKSRSSIANTLRLLDLPLEVREAIEQGAISEGHGRAILMSPSEGGRRALLRRAVRDQLSVRETERMASAEGGKSASKPSSKANDAQIPSEMFREKAVETAHSDAELKDIASRLEKRLGTRINIRAKGRRGGIVISYAEPAELERIIGLLLPAS